MTSVKVRLISMVVYVVVRLFSLSYRIRVFGIESREQAEKSHATGSFALALWHEHLWAGIVCHAGQKIAPLASLSKDGQVVTYVLDRLGYRTVRGSSSRGGEAAREHLVDISNRGWFPALTIDGPRGPRRQVKGGVVDVARRTGIQILPMVALPSKPLIMSRSWDHFQIPLPFSRIALRYGAPILVPPETKGLAFGAIKQAIKTELLATEHRAREDLRAWSSEAKRSANG